MKNILYLILFIALTSISCSSNRNLAATKRYAQQLSGKLKFTVNAKDNLYLMQEATNWLGTPYRLGGETKSGIDCSGLVKAIYKNLYGIQTHRTVETIFQNDIRKIGKRKAKSGDLLFFASTKSKRKITHIGIFLKKGYFIHASSSNGVIISHLSEPYYKKTWRKSGKVK